MADETVPELHPPRPRGRSTVTAPVAVVLALACLAGFAARCASTRLPLFHDEAATLLAARRIAETGIPMLPSGVLYLHGAVISYLLAPLGWLGWLDIANVENLRLVNAAIGVAAIPLAFLVGRTASGSQGVGAAAAALVALDPAGVLWGSYLRMYALLEVLAAGFALAFLHAIAAPAERPNRAALGWMIATFWLAMFSQTVAALLLPAAAAVAVALFGRELLGARRSLTAALLACAAAVAAYLALTRFGSAGGAASIAQGGGLPGVRFLGDDQIDLSRLIDPNAWSVREVLGGHPFGEVLPFVFVGLICVVVGRVLAADAPPDGPARGAGALLALGLLPVLALVFLVRDSGERYLTGSLVPLLALTGWGWWLVRPGWPAFAPLAGWLARALAAAILAGMVLARDGWMLTHLRDWGPLRYGDQRAAVLAIAAERERGNLAIGNFPVVMAETLGSAEGVRFLNDTGLWAGPSPDGSPRDYWLGNPMITSAGALCETAAANPGSFIIAAKI
ncbi:MAG: hypothetical protein ACKOWF_16840 [Chloroflexota bacterium]